MATSCEIGDADTDSRAVEAVVECFYSGKPRCRGHGERHHCMANMLQVGTVEKAACDFFTVRWTRPPRARPWLRPTHMPQVESMRIACANGAWTTLCSTSVSAADPSFVELPCGLAAEVIKSDCLPADEEVVLAAVRAWFAHDKRGRQGSLTQLLPLVRWPLLPLERQLGLPRPATLVHDAQ